MEIKGFTFDILWNVSIKEDGFMPEESKRNEEITLVPRSEKEKLQYELNWIYKKLGVENQTEVMGKLNIVCDNYDRYRPMIEEHYDIASMKLAGIVAIYKDFKDGEMHSAYAMELIKKVIQ